MQRNRDQDTQLQTAASGIGRRPLAQSVLLISAMALAPGVGVAESLDNAVADVELQAAAVSFAPRLDADGMTLTVNGPGGRFWRHPFAAGEEIVFPPAGAFDLIDGGYTYELTVIPRVDNATRRQMVRDGDEYSPGSDTAEEMEISLPERRIQSGFFRVVGGVILTDHLRHEPRASQISTADRSFEPRAGFAATGIEEAQRGPIVSDRDEPTEDQVILDDLIVDGSACIGFDCVNGESFGFDTIRVKENNLRIRFFDTSSTASFPSNDWQLTANDSANGGANKFSIDDIDGGRTPFTVEAGAPSHSLYVDDGGRLGFGTSTPVVDLHVKSGNTPTLRLEQDGSAGFQPQTWDVAGNEAGFFIRDATNGSTLPFRIRPGAPSSAIDIAASGRVGFGDSSPDAHVDVEGRKGAASAALFTDDGTTPGQVSILSTDDTDVIPLVVTDTDGVIAARIEGGILQVRNDADINTQIRLSAGGEEWSIVNVPSQDALIFEDRTSATNPVRFQGPSIAGTLVVKNGRVGVMTGTPMGELDVNGAIYQRGALLHADYVFEPDYELASIEEQVAEMWQSKHLPAVPKATVDEAGREVLEMGSHRRGMLEELEKAHIYIGQLNEMLCQLRESSETKDQRIQDLEQQTSAFGELERRLTQLEMMIGAGNAR